MPAEKRRSALLEGVTAGVLFGTAAVFVRFAAGINASSVAFWRLAIAFAALTIFVLFSRKALQVDLIRKNAKTLIVLSALLGFHFVFFTSAVNDTTILNATVLVNTVPFFSLLISALVFRLKPSRQALFGLGISFIGIWLIAIGESVIKGTTGGVSPSLRGDLEAVFAAVFLALYLNYGKVVRNRMNIFSLMMPIYLVASLFVGFGSLAFGNSVLSIHLTPVVVASLIGLGLLPTAVAHTLYFSSLSSLKSFETATLALLEPVGATILGIAAFDEVPAPIFALGAALVLAGIFFTIRKGEKGFELS